MKDYHLLLVGLRIVLRTPFEITISESLKPFLCEPHEKADCTIELQSCDALPPFSENGSWHGLEFYDSYAGRMRIFHRETSRNAVFAMTQLHENGNIEIQVLPECLSYFTGTSGIFNRIGMETLLLQHYGLLLHASLIKYGGKAIAFSGPSGVGKSTQADIWRKHLGAEIINGDRAALRKGSEGWMAYGSPYAGTSGIYKNDGAPLAAIILLRQAEENQILPLAPGEAFRYLYPEISAHRWEKAFVAKVTDICLQMLAEIPVYLMACRPEEGAAQLVKKELGL